MCRRAEHDGQEDPCPQLPSSFKTPGKVANIAEKPLPDIALPEDEKPTRVVYEGPRRVLRTAVSSMACSDDFGPMMRREAARRRFYDAPLRAFLGDGLNWNWSIWQQHFRTFVPILDVIHAIQYLFNAAMVLGAKEAEGWEIYVRLVTLCWQGCVEIVIDELIAACEQRGIVWETRAVDDDPHKPLSDAIRYLKNNRSRMDYSRYRRLGLPVTSAPMESLIKQINIRVKGTEMFWDDPHGAEAILQLRAAALSEDNRLDNYLSRRPGWPFQRRSTSAELAA